MHFVIILDYKTKTGNLKVFLYSIFLFWWSNDKSTTQSTNKANIVDHLNYIHIFGDKYFENKLFRCKSKNRFLTI